MPKHKKKRRQKKFRRFGILGERLSTERLDYLLRDEVGPKRLAQEEQARQKGKASEILVWQLLLEMVSNNILSFAVSSINRTKPGYPKVDIFVHTLVGILPVQVKTSLAAEYRFRRRNPDIICIATADKSKDKLRQELIVKLEKEYQSLTEA